MDNPLSQTPEANACEYPLLEKPLVKEIHANEYPVDKPPAREIHAGEYILDKPLVKQEVNAGEYPLHEPLVKEVH